MPNTEELQKIEGILGTMAETIKRQGDDWALKIKEIIDDFEELDTRLDSHAELIRSLLIWRDSNGSPGAEERLRNVEKCAIEVDRHKLPTRMDMAEANITILQHVADSSIMAGVQGAVSETLDKRARTAVEMLKAWGPIVSATLAAIAIVLSAVLR
jgi:hypothetical protein